MYVPIVQRAATLWNELSEIVDSSLFTRTGGLAVGRPGGALARGAAESVRVHDLPCEIWTASDIRNRVPALRVTDDMTGIWEPGAGVLFAERCVAALLQDAERSGAQILFDTMVTGCQPGPGQFTIATGAQDYRVQRVIVTAGPWTAGLLGGWQLPLTVERAVQFWFSPRDGSQFVGERFPVFLLEYAPDRLLYGLPNFGHGVKVAHHHGGRIQPIEDVPRLVEDREVDEMRATVSTWLPDAAGALTDATVCVYTNTPDHHFVIDRHPHAPGMVVASCCSGHGFKFATAIGEILADVVSDSQPRFDLSPFRADRFGH
jgi:monomeric sarcosine oxidase